MLNICSIKLKMQNHTCYGKYNQLCDSIQHPHESSMSCMEALLHHTIQNMRFELTVCNRKCFNLVLIEMKIDLGDSYVTRSFTRSSYLDLTVAITGSVGTALKSPQRINGLEVPPQDTTQLATSFPCSFLIVERSAPWRAFKWVVATQTCFPVSFILRFAKIQTWKRIEYIYNFLRKDFFGEKHFHSIIIPGWIARAKFQEFGLMQRSNQIYLYDKIGHSHRARYCS